LGRSKTAMTSSGENGNVYSGHWNMANGTAGATFISGHMSRALKQRTILFSRSRGHGRTGIPDGPNFPAYPCFLPEWKPIPEV
ncbi:hypothetical protein, partial [Akkermansia sp.]|uniref:hypothetical protein n=1 Tax=Akkermansia sp. TaxID=1872421 RepID=UPI003AAB7B79